ncbi:carbonic anhydrase [Monoraphidium neglectum]|uniref:carbonic anhydrase n=1 Tax=Monoraphidium neglectum TaxID=145388 RepID=A0A0D2K486_9CHLO|nr:carbonic anhydrase [Monoraphidium neglectum]KIZ05223.1 carbonic anhydrase [Monoraphidium neglectum]|eukprot:XP_013904242.1 carbonic anhydrase [Monoraphidium neglectum]
MAACPCCEALASGGAVFDYGSLSGPQKWGGVCSAGTRQSPINIPRKALAAALKRPTGVGAGTCRPAQLNITGYKPAKPSILNTGVGTMQVNFAKGSQVLLCGGSELELLQYHFHTPSEHAFDGDRTAMEVHLVHKNATTGA